VKNASSAKEPYDNMAFWQKDENKALLQKRHRNFGVYSSHGYPMGGEYAYKYKYIYNMEGEYVHIYVYIHTHTVCIYIHIYIYTFPDNMI